MRTTLVVGASGNLGSVVVRKLLERGQRVHAHMRSANAAVPGNVQTLLGDLKTGEGLAAATSGADAIIHCATFFDADGATDLEGTRNVIKAAKAADAPHLVYISIVGVDRISFPYFKTKLAVEKIVEESGLPHTILRATQFHGFMLRFIAGFEDASKKEIALPAGLKFQSIAIEEVATALVEASERAAAGRLPDIAGPKAHTLDEMAALYRGIARNDWTITSLAKDPQAAFHDAFREGRNLAPERAVGRLSWERFLQQQR